MPEVANHLLTKSQTLFAPMRIVRRLVDVNEMSQISCSYSRELISNSNKSYYLYLSTTAAVQVDYSLIIVKCFINDKTTIIQMITLINCFCRTVCECK